MTRRVLVLHGLWMPRASMAWHARRLRRAGYAPQLFGYGAVTGGPAAAMPGLLARLQDPVDILAHSLGGLLAVRALQAHPELPVGRIVCLGSPLCGSAAATGMARRPFGAASLGRSARLLRRGCKPWAGPGGLGMIAGNLPMGFGRFFGGFSEPNDGTVAVSETRLEGLADHVVLPTSHSGLLVSKDASRQALHFLGHGRFAPPA